MPRTIVLAAAATTAACAAALALAGPATAATTSSTPSATAKACDASAWEAAVQGRPADYRSGAPVGDYLWHDSHGFHLRVTHAKEDRRVFTGEITSSTAMRIDPVHLEKGDVLRLSANHRSLVFAFANYGLVDGVDFHTDCATSLTVSHLNVGNSTLPDHDVYLGAKDTHPAHVPFTVHRRASSAA